MKNRRPPQTTRSLSLEPIAEPRARRLALGVVLVLLVERCRFSRPALDSSRWVGSNHSCLPTPLLFLSLNSITAALLFAQFSVLRSPALLALASGYLWSGFIAIPWVLTFPGVFPQGVPLGAAFKVLPWLYLFWHEGFICFVIGYILLKNFDPLDRFSKARLRGVVLAASDWLPHSSSARPFWSQPAMRSCLNHGRYGAG